MEETFVEFMIIVKYSFEFFCRRKLCFGWGEEGREVSLGFAAILSRKF
jgi:hypothetical protein